LISEIVAIAFSALSLLAQDDAAAPPETFIGKLLTNPMTPLVGLFLLFYFIFILPEKRRKAQEANLMSSLKKNDRVVTIGGFHAVVVAAPQDSPVITVRLDENTRVKINRSAIAKIVHDDTDGKNKEPDPETKDG
jgi:preprotein translocase subunit YajC